MKRWKKRRKWQKKGVLILAGILFVIAAGRGMADEKQIYRNAVSTISPMFGYILQEETGEEVSSQETVVSSDELLQEEWEQWLLAEQAGTVPQITGYVEYFPEDLEGEEDGEIEADLDMEWDAALLAEIERENRAMEEQARQEAEAREQEEAQVSAEAAAQVLSLPYSMDQLQDLDFLISSCYTVNKTTTVDSSLLDAAAMLEKDMKLQSADSGGPKILIHHTHATEYFADSNEKDPSTLIVGVGDYLEEILENQYGIEVLHDRTVYPYNEAYSQALKHVEELLAENPTIEVFIDLHRDSGGGKKYTVEIDGKETANLMFFNGISRNVNGTIDYLPNENLEENLAFSFQLKMAGDSLYPGLCKRNYLKSYRYNLHVLPRAVIVEVGDNNNTLEEAMNAMEPLAKILNYVLTGELR